MISSVGISGKWFRARLVIKKPKKQKLLSQEKIFIKTHLEHVPSVDLEHLNLKIKNHNLFLYFDRLFLVNRSLQSTKKCTYIKTLYHFVTLN